MRMLFLAALCCLAATGAKAFQETPDLVDLVREGRLPPVGERLPDTPLVAAFDRSYAEPGRHGGDLRLVFTRNRDLRQVGVYAYTRLVAYDEDFTLQSDILAGVDVSDGGRVFTLRIRPGHRWSDGAPFTAEDFRYYWDAIATHEVIYPTGPDTELWPNGALPRFEVLDPLTVRFSWAEPNPYFLPALARPNAVFIYRPAHYLRRFHADYADPDELAARVEAERKRDWRALHFSKDRIYHNDNPELPTLFPWRPMNAPPAERIVYERNPFYHKVDPDGRQLPYIDRVLVSFADPGLIPAKVGAGEVDLHGLYLNFSNFTALKNAARRNNLEVDLWRRGRGAEIALYPNQHHKDPVWRSILKNADFRRALSLAINREDINKVLFFGLAHAVGDYVLPLSPLYDEDQARRWADFDPARANALLDRIGLPRGEDGMRRLPDGRRIEITVEHDGSNPERTDALQLIAETWAEIGVRLRQRAMTRDVLKRRMRAGSTLMAADVGMNNGLATPAMPPVDLAPKTPGRMHWMQWGSWTETGGQIGEPVDDPVARALLDDAKRWATAETEAAKATIWRHMLAAYVDEVFVIGVVAGGRQPVVRNARLRNLPKSGVFNWDPGAYFGLYGLDAVWFAEPAPAGG